MPTPQSQSTKPARVSRSEGIAAILREEILRGQYRAGERLPSERDLTTRFATSRGAVREALKKLEQLGIASIQRGGARVVSVEHCTLDVLGPLLDLDDIPDAKLVDEVLQVFGVLMDTAAHAAMEKATDEDLAYADGIIAEILSPERSDVHAHAAMRRLGEFFVDVADHLVLRLIVNGLRTTFLARLRERGFRLKLADASWRRVAMELRVALAARDAAGVGRAMRRLNRIFRNSARDALVSARTGKERTTA